MPTAGDASRLYLVQREDAAVEVSSDFRFDYDASTISIRTRVAIACPDVPKTIRQLSFSGCSTGTTGTPVATAKAGTARAVKNAPSHAPRRRVATPGAVPSQDEASNKGMAIAGLVTGVIAFALAIWGITIIMSGLNQVSTELNELDHAAAPATQAQHAVTHRENRMVHQGLWIGNS